MTVFLVIITGWGVSQLSDSAFESTEFKLFSTREKADNFVANYSEDDAIAYGWEGVSSLQIKEMVAE